MKSAMYLSAKKIKDKLKYIDEIDGLVHDRRNSILVILQERQKTVCRIYYNTYL